MSDHSKKRSKSAKSRRRQNVRWLSSVTAILVLIIAGWIWWEAAQENRDLSLIGKGENVVVQVHDPG